MFSGCLPMCSECVFINLSTADLHAHTIQQYAYICVHGVALTMASTDPPRLFLPSQSFLMGIIVASGALSKILGPLWGT